MDKKNRTGYRGYICARMEMGRSTPQHIQQMVMREYCKQREMVYLLAAVEYCMTGCTMILNAVLDELDHLEGIIMYSLYMFPQNREKRLEMYKRLFERNCTLHTAVENIVIRNWEDAAKIEDIWLTNDVMKDQKPEDFEFLEEWDREYA